MNDKMPDFCDDDGSGYGEFWADDERSGELFKSIRDFGRRAFLSGKRNPFKPDPDDPLDANEQNRKKLVALLELLGTKGTCKGCNAGIYWCVTKTRKWIPIDERQLIPHHVTCSKVKDFRRKRDGESRTD